MDKRCPKVSCANCPIYIENLIFLFRFVKRRSIQGLRYICTDLIAVVSDISSYCSSGAGRAAEQAAVPLRAFVLTSFLQFVACHAAGCKILVDDSNIESSQIN